MLSQSVLRTLHGMIMNDPWNAQGADFQHSESYENKDSLYFGHGLGVLRSFILKKVHVPSHIFILTFLTVKERCELLETTMSRVSGALPRLSSDIMRDLSLFRFSAGQSFLLRVSWSLIRPVFDTGACFSEHVGMSVGNVFAMNV